MCFFRTNKTSDRVVKCHAVSAGLMINTISTYKYDTYRSSSEFLLKFQLVWLEVKSICCENCARGNYTVILKTIKESVLFGTL